MTNNIIKQQYKVTLKIPFPNHHFTEICSAVLRIDQEPSRSFIAKNIQIFQDSLVISFSGDKAKNLRVAVSSFVESLILCCQTMMEFDILSESYSCY